MGKPAASKPSAKELPRPFVTANFALTWDARITTRLGTPSTFSSKRDKQRLLEIRSRADAVLAGATTVAADRMTMGLPDAALRKDRIARRQSEYPLRVLLSNSGNIDPRLPVFEKDFSPIVIFSTSRISERRRSQLSQKADLWLHDGEAVDLKRALATLRSDYHVKRLVCEGGARLFRGLVETRLIDEICVTLCPLVFGGMGAPSITGVAGDFLPVSLPLALHRMEVIDGECFLQDRTARQETLN